MAAMGAVTASAATAVAVSHNRREWAGGEDEAVVEEAEAPAAVGLAVALGTRPAAEWRRKSETEEGRTRGRRPEGPSFGARR